MRAKMKALVAQNFDYFDSPEFCKRGVETKLFGNGFNELSLPSTRWYAPTLAKRVVSESHLMESSEERLMFLRFNYAKLRLKKLQRKFNKVGKLSRKEVVEFTSWHKRLTFLREYITRSNLSLVISMRGRMGTRAGTDFQSAVSEGNLTILRAIDKFDVERGNKFSTYACRAILKNLSRESKREAKRQNRQVPIGLMNEPATSRFAQRREEQSELFLDTLREVLRANTARLTKVQVVVLTRIYNLDNAQASGFTLEQVGEIVGVSKERVRQIRNKALEKLKDVFAKAIEEKSSRQTNTTAPP